MLAAFCLGTLPLHATQLLPGVYGFGLDRTANSAGFGANAVVVEVTNLNDSGAGSLREAVTKTIAGNPSRIVVFTVSGVIKAQSNIGISQANTTVAGQTAPAPGIAIHGAGLGVGANNVLVQHLRVRPGDEWNDNYRLNNRDAANLSSGVNNVVFDHCTFMWSSDELVECYAEYGNITFNKCLFAEPLNIAIHLDEGTLANDGLIPPQTEAMARAVSDSGRVSVTDATSVLAVGSNYQVASFASPSGDWVEYRMELKPISTARTHVYPLVAGIKGPDRGRFRIEVWKDDLSVLFNNNGGSDVVFDQYAPVESAENFIPRDFEFTVPVEDPGPPVVGTRWIRVRLVSAGKNPASSGNTIGLDQLSLTQGHGFGPLFSSGRAGAGRLAIINSIIASSVGRNPWISSKQGVIANNVLYNRWQNFAQVLNPQANDVKWASRSTWVGNTFIEGPSLQSWVGSSPIAKAGDQNGASPNPVEHSEIYAADNAYNHGDKASPKPVLDPAFAAGGYLAASDPVTYSDGMQGFVPQAAVTAYAGVIAGAGAFPVSRDSAEARVINEISTSVSIPALASRLGSIKHTLADAGGWPVLAEHTATWTLPANPNAPANPADPTGYTNIEVWLHGLAAAIEGGSPLDSPVAIFDDFQDGNANSWTPTGGSWSIVTDGSLVYQQADPSGLAATILAGTNWADQAITTDAKAISLGASFGVIVHYQDAGNYYALVLRGDNTLELRKQVNGLPVALASAPFAVSPGTSYRLNLEIIGTALKAYVNDSLVVQATDSTFDSGSAGLLTDLTSAAFDQVAANPFPGVVPAPEINVRGNNTTIVDGDPSPSPADHTDFGSIDATIGSVTRTFLVQNSGTAELTVNAVAVSGADAADFTVTVQPAPSIPVGGSTTFSVRFDPSAIGVRTATLNFGNTDANEDPYSFSIQGTGSAPSALTTITIISTDDTLDGRIVESGAGTDVGGTVVKASAAFDELRTGDDSILRQQKSFLSFDTSVLPDGAVVTAATLKLRRASGSDANPYAVTSLGNMLLDIRNGAFNDNVALESADFQAPASVSGVAIMSPANSNGTFSTGSINAEGLAQFNKTGTTQFRLRFTNKHNNNSTATYISFNSGGAPQGRQPELTITYFIPDVPPTIVTQPVAQTATVGDNVVLALDATGTGPFSFQWRRDGVPLAGNSSAHTSALTLANVTSDDAGTYDCVVTNIAGSAISEPAGLTVNKAGATVILGPLNFTYDGTPHPTTAKTVPAQLPVAITYNNDDPTAPTNAGSYEVMATIDDPNYFGSTSGTLVIAKAIATVDLGDLDQTYTGSPLSAVATTIPAGLTVDLTYDNGPTAPTNVGSHQVVGTIRYANYDGTATGFLVITKATAPITLAPLAQVYDGAPKPVTATTLPAGLAVDLTYGGSATAPTLPGSYAVVGTINDDNYTGTLTETLLIQTTALVRHLVSLNGGIDGSIQVTTAEAIAINGSAWIASDLLVPGTPTVRLHGHPTYGGTIDGTGETAPSNHLVTLNGNSILRHVVRRIDPRDLPVVVAPPAPAGTRNVSINNAGQSPGDFATLRDLTLNGNVGSVAVPAGTYGSFTVNGGNSLVLGEAGAIEPAVYNLQGLTLKGNSQLQVVGPVIVNLAGGVSLNTSAGDSGHPEWLDLNLATGGLTLNGNIEFCGFVTAPSGTITINGNSTLSGGIIADRLIVNGNGLLKEP